MVPFCGGARVACVTAFGKSPASALTTYLVWVLTPGGRFQNSAPDPLTIVNGLAIRKSADYDYDYHRVVWICYLKVIESRSEL